MWTKERKDLGAGVFLLASALFLCLYLIPFHVQMETASSLSPRFFPYLLSVVLGLLSLVFLGQSWLSIKKQTSENQNDVPEDIGRGGSKLITANTLRPFAAIALLGIYFVLFEYFYFLAATPIILAGLMLLFGQKKLRVFLITCPVVSVALYLLFEVGLKVPLD